MPEPYLNRELDEKFVDIANALSRIEIQTTTTNGRVNKLENWRWFITGGISVITVIVVPLLAWALYVLSTINTQIAQGVNQSLSAYNVQVK